MRKLIKAISIPFYTLSVFWLMTAIACNKTDSSNSNGGGGNNQNVCNVMCTQSFAMITVQVTDIKGNPVVLDDAYTVREPSKTILRFNSQLTPGNYTVLDDSYMDQIRKQTATFIFTGYSKGIKVVADTFIISADCCHVQKQSGNIHIVTN